METKHCTTLPENHKTWTDFYLAIKHLEADNINGEFYTELTPEVILTKDTKPPVKLNPILRYRFSFVKQQAFEELLNLRDEFLKPIDFRYIVRCLNWASSDYDRNEKLEQQLIKLTDFKKQ